MVRKNGDVSSDDGRNMPIEMTADAAGSATAFATIVIAVFTIILAGVGGVQGYLLSKQIKLARDEFNSTHRAHIIVHAVEVAFDVSTDAIDKSTEPTVGASIIYFNVGATSAQLTQISAKITRRGIPLQSGIALGIGTDLSPLAVPKGDVEPGHPEFVAVHSSHTLEGERFAQRHAGDNGRESALVLIGKISYRDARNVDRQTGFCRRLDVKTVRWIPLDGYPEYEYAY